MRLGMCFPRELPAGMVTTFAERLDAGGVDELWVIEDCFYTAGISLAATALARTERLVVGLGILPAVARTAAVTAMELATLGQLAPGRIIGGIGHGIQEWMGQMGVRPARPVATLEATMGAVRRLLDGEEVTVDAAGVVLDHVRLEATPTPRPLVLAGVRGPRSLAAAGRCADGVVLAEMSGPSTIRDAIAAAGSPPGFEVAVYTTISVGRDRRAARRDIAPFIAEMVAAPSTGLRHAPFFDELQALSERRGVDGIVDMPDDWWTELSGAGTVDDVVAHVAALTAAGAGHVAFFPAPEADLAMAQLDDVLAVSAALRS
jgi:alkanesulfonate monooxygenase SsuD/methylene tetrahydromethanopterin reductase-like flavin-dependent oxidoreductase (luciferase family)